jgi:hypothetical protein
LVLLRAAECLRLGLEGLAVLVVLLHRRLGERLHGRVAVLDDGRVSAASYVATARISSDEFVCSCGDVECLVGGRRSARASR